MNIQTKISEFDMSSTGGGATQGTRTTTPISGPLNGAPTAGVIEIRSSDTAAGVNRIVRVTMQSDGTALVEIDSNGDGVVDQTITVPWFGGIGLGGGFGGGVPPVTGGPPVATPGRLAPPTGGAPISPVPPIGGLPGFAPGLEAVSRDRSLVKSIAWPWLSLSRVILHSN